MNQAVLLEIENLGKAFTRGTREFWGLKDANLTLCEGEFVTLLGKSGAGKSTLLTMLVGLQTPTTGSVRYQGQDLFAFTDKARSQWRNQTMGYVPQGAGMVASLCIIDNVRLPWYLAKRGPEPEGRAKALMDQFGLVGLYDEKPSALSGGELRRAAVARALMNEPRMIIADEPTASLDQASAKIVMEAFRTCADQGISVLVVTHDTQFLDLSDRIFHMEAGHLTDAPLKGE